MFASAAGSECAVKHVVIAAALLAAAPYTAAQTPAGADSTPAPTFRAQADLVALAVTVVDERDDHLSGLALSDFVVMEDGIEQPLSYFAASAVPVDITLLVDASASMGDKMAVVREAVHGLTGALRPGDRAAVVEFRTTTTERQAMTGDQAAIDAAMSRLTGNGDTAMYTALYVTLSGMRTSSRGGDVRRQAVVVLSDGDDTASLVGYEDVLEKARRRGVAIYAVSLQSPVSRGRLRRAGSAPATDGERALGVLARETGGVAFFPGELRQLPEVYRVIAQELGRQYMVGYTPREPSREGGWRSVKVRLPAYPRATVRARSGYYAGDGSAFAATRLRADRH